MHLLEMPAITTCAHLDGDDRRRVEVVSRAHGAVEVRPRIARREIDEPELGIERRCLPNCAAAVLPELIVLRPRFVTGLAAPRNRIERPDELAVRRVERFHAAAHAELGAREA